jgi:hypothetical protein
MTLFPVSYQRRRGGKKSESFISGFPPKMSSARERKMFGFSTRSGVDVMITIFCHFSQFSAKKWAFFLNTNVMINFFKI